MKYIKYSKKYLALFISLNLVITSIPVMSLSSSCLAPPGNSELTQYVFNSASEQSAEPSFDHLKWVAIQIAAGEGKRMKLDYSMPKLIIPVAGRKMILYFIYMAEKMGLRTIVVVPEGDDTIENNIMETCSETVSAKLGTFNALIAARDNLKMFSGHIVIIPADVIIIDPDILTSAMNFHAASYTWYNVFTFLTRTLSNPHSFDRIVRREDGKFDNKISQTAIDFLKENNLKLTLSDGTELRADELEAIKEVWGDVLMSNSFIYKTIVSLWKWLFFLRPFIRKDSFSGEKKYAKAKKRNLRAIRMRGFWWRLLLKTGVARVYASTKEDVILNINTKEHLHHTEQICLKSKDLIKKYLADKEPEYIKASYTDLYRVFLNCISGMPRLVEFFLGEIFARLSFDKQKEILREFGIDFKFTDRPSEDLRYDSYALECEQIKAFLRKIERCDILDEFGKKIVYPEEAEEFLEFFKNNKKGLYKHFKEWIEVRPYVRFFEIAGIEKAGQFLSTQKGWIPEKFRKAFKIFQDNAIPAEREESVSVIETHFGKTLSEIFLELKDNDPGTPLEGISYLRRLKAGTVATTFFARLHNGEDVVLKIVTPGKRKRVLRGLNILLQVARKLEEKKERFSRDKKQTILISPFTFFTIFRKYVLRELNLNIEAIQGERLIPKHPRGIGKPRINYELTGKNVLVMSYIKGTKATELKNELQRKIVAKKIMPFIILQALADGAHHSNPQPGNVLYKEENNEPFPIDYGQIGELPDDMKKEVIKLCVRILHHNIDNRPPPLTSKIFSEAPSYRFITLLGKIENRCAKSGISFLCYLLSKRWVAKLTRYVLFNFLYITEFYQIKFAKKPDMRARVLKYLKERKKVKKVEKKHFLYTEDFDKPLKELCDENIPSEDKIDDIIEFLAKKGEKTGKYDEQQLQKHIRLILENPPGWGEEEQPFLVVDRIVYAAESTGIIIKTPFSDVVGDIFPFFEKYAIVKDNAQTTAAKLQIIALKAEIATILRFQREGDSIFAKLNRILIAGERFGYPVVTTAAGMLVKAILEAEGLKLELKGPPETEEESSSLNLKFNKVESQSLQASN